LLFINQGLNEDAIPTFKEMAKEYGLNDGGYSQQTVFFDYDKDGDLDAYIVHNGNYPVFTNISKTAGITHKGFGLGVAINDFNNDGSPDVYVSNDFITDDLLYVNNFNSDSLNTTFTEESNTYLAHQTYNAMGVDIADINNDMLSDILVLDMLPNDYMRRKKMLGVMNYDKYLMAKSRGYASQYMHNTLQIANGNLKNKPIKFTEVGFLKNIASTDWSWAPLLIDFNNDGLKDIYVTNGYVKDITDLDFINFSDQNNIFGTPETRQKKLKSFVKTIPEIKLPNFYYKQNEDGSFQDVSSTWKKEQATLSNGAAYADLDLDGDLDLIVNNINAEASVIENLNNSAQSNYLRVQLKGKPQNKNAIGSKVTLWHNGTTQFQYQSVIRGYLSSVEPILHFGLKDTAIDSLQIIWPNQSISTLKNVAINQVITVDASEAVNKQIQLPVNQTVLNKTNRILKYTHKENQHNDYTSQHLLVKQYSQFGPCLAVGNINKASGDELFIGGSKGVSGQIWEQDVSGSYKLKKELETNYEDTDAVFFDADNDGDKDLYVCSGGNEYPNNSMYYQDQLYINDGLGNFLNQSESRLPQVFESSSCVRPIDIDHDGDLDVFVGTRLIPGSYPKTPKNYILINQNGKFSIQNSKTPILGMVTDALWQDIDADGWEDLIVVGEWMPMQIYKNTNGTLKPFDLDFIDVKDDKITTEGWWNVIKPADFDNDGDIETTL